MFEKRTRLADRRNPPRSAVTTGVRGIITARKWQKSMLQVSVVATVLAQEATA